MDRASKDGNPNRRFTLYLINIIILSAVTLFAVASAVITRTRLDRTLQSIEDGQGGSTARLHEVREQVATDARLEVLGEIRDSLEAGESTLSVLRELFPGDIVTYSGGKYYFTSVNPLAAAKTVTAENLVFGEDGSVRTEGAPDGTIVQRGIDVSELNGEIDWSRAAENGISFAMVRLGYVDADGSVREDRRFARNFAGALQSGIRVGCYMELTGDDEETLLAQTRFFADTMEPYGSRITFPAALRISLAEGGEEEAVSLRAQRTEALEKACALLEERGFTPMIGGDLTALSLCADISGLQERDIWYTGADASLAYPYDWTMWQYRSGVPIEGIEGAVELDVYVTVQ